MFLSRADFGQLSIGQECSKVATESPKLGVVRSIRTLFASG